MAYTSTYNSPLGPITIAADEGQLIGVWFDGQKHFGSTLKGLLTEERHDLGVFQDARRWLDTYFSGSRPDFLPDIKLIGSEFQKRVWLQLLQIPYGRLTSYGNLSQRLNPKSSPRAVGTAVGRNPISLIIPCHRVVGADGSLTGYAGGVERKRRLLAIEGINPCASSLL